MAKKKELKKEVQRRERRSIDEMIAHLEGKIATIKAREAHRQAKADPAKKHVSAALKAIDKALAASKDSATKKALNEARTTLSASLGVSVPASTRRSASEIESLADTLLQYVRGNPGQRGEQIAAALGTDTTTMRPIMKRLIAEGKIATEGQKRGMTYAAV